MPFKNLPIVDQGVVRENRVSRQAIKKTYQRSLALAYNCDLRQKMGAVVVRKGSRKIGSSNATTSIIPLGVGIMDSLAHNRPFGVWNESGNAVLTYFTGAGWSTASGFPTTATEYNFVQLGGRIFAVGASVMYESDSLATFTSQENRGCLQLPAKVVWEMGGRIFASQITGRSGYVQFSSLWNPAGYDSVATKNITWNTDITSGDALIINPDDGAGEVVGGIFTGNTYVIFKERATYMYRKAQRGVEPDAYLQVGSANKDSYTACQGFGYFFSAPTKKTSGTESGGIYKTNGGSLKDISWAIQDIIDSVADPKKVRLESDQYSVYAYLGDISIDDVTYSNVVMVYHTINDTWEGPHSFPYDDMRMVRGSTFGLIAQTKLKMVQLETDDSTDDGTQIEYNAKSNVQEIEEELYLKSLNFFGIYTQKATGSTLRLSTKKRGRNDGSNDIAINQDMQDIQNPVSGEFNSLTYEWFGIKDREPAIFEGAIIDYTRTGLKK